MEFNYADLSAVKAFNRNHFDESFSAINFVFYFTENTVKNALQVGDILQTYAVGDQSDEHINDFGVINNGGPRSGHWFGGADRHGNAGLDYTSR